MTSKYNALFKLHLSCFKTASTTEVVEDHPLLYFPFRSIELSGSYRIPCHHSGTKDEHLHYRRSTGRRGWDDLTAVLAVLVYTAFYALLWLFFSTTISKTGHLQLSNFNKYWIILEYVLLLWYGKHESSFKLHAFWIFLLASSFHQACAEYLTGQCNPAKIYRFGIHSVYVKLQGTREEAF
ncbi:hypothetical protein BJ912DRAFT_1014070 [Pholiota molesta]|nr:hypothetical protein BJ912DRAFT_1014070 [Pholiota molesta]